MFLFDFNWQIQHLLNQAWWPINFLLLVIAVFLGWLAYRKPIYAVAGVIILLPTYLVRSNFGFLPVTFLEISIWITFAGWFFNVLKNKTLPKKINPYVLPITLIILASTIGVLISPNLQTAAGLWKAYFIEPILFFIVLISIVNTKKDKEIILWALGISTLVVSSLGIIQKFNAFGIAESSWIKPDRRRVTSIFSSPNAVGLYLAPIVMIYFGWLISEFKKRCKDALQCVSTILKILVIIPALIAIIFTVSQGTWLGLLAATLFLLFFGWSKKITSAIIIIGIVGVMLFASASDVTSHRLQEMITFQDRSGQNRLMLWQASSNFLLENPKHFILGAGIAGFADIHEQARDPLVTEPLLYPHNIFLNFWMEIGLFGMAGFVWLLWIFFHRVIPAKAGIQISWLQLGITAAMITIIVHGLIDVPYFKNDLSVLFWVIIALL